MRHRLAWGTAIVVGAVASPAAHAAPPEPGVPQVVTLANHYLPGDSLGDQQGAEPVLPVSTLVLPAGSRLQLTNVETIAYHDVTHEGCRSGNPDPCLFESPVTGRVQGSSEVAGVADLPPGTYSFYCSVHSSTMFGTLVILEEA